MTLSVHLDTAAVSALVTGLACLLVPRLIALVPEPEPTAQRLPATVPDADPGDVPAGEPPAGEELEPTIAAEDPPKELYADVAAAPGLAWKTGLVGALSGALLGGGLGWIAPLSYLLLLVPISVALTVIDWRTKLLPTWLILRGYAVTVVLVLACFAIDQDVDSLIRAGWGWLIASVGYFVLWFIYPKGMGYGDVRLSGVLGIAMGYLGWPQLLVGLWLGFLLGGIGGGLLSVLMRSHRKHFPFGPFMFLGALLGVLFGEWLMWLYVGMRTP